MICTAPNIDAAFVSATDHKRHVDGDLRKTEHKSYDNRIDEHFIAKYDWTKQPGNGRRTGDGPPQRPRVVCNPLAIEVLRRHNNGLDGEFLKTVGHFGKPEQPNTYLGIQQDRIAPIPQHKVGEAPTRARNNLLVTLERLRKTRGM